jgi:hypothetical protein
LFLKQDDLHQRATDENCDIERFFDLIDTELADESSVRDTDDDVNEEVPIETVCDGNAILLEDTGKAMWSTWNPDGPLSLDFACEATSSWFAHNLADVADDAHTDINTSHALHRIDGALEEETGASDTPLADFCAACVRIRLVGSRIIVVAMNDAKSGPKHALMIAKGVRNAANRSSRYVCRREGLLCYLDALGFATLCREYALSIHGLKKRSRRLLLIEFLSLVSAKRLKLQPWGLFVAARDAVLRLEASEICAAASAAFVSVLSVDHCAGGVQADTGIPQELRVALGSVAACRAKGFACDPIVLETPLIQGSPVPLSIEFSSGVGMHIAALERPVHDVASDCGVVAPVPASSTAAVSEEPYYVASIPAPETGWPEFLEFHLDCHSISVRAMADHLGIPYPDHLDAWLGRGPNPALPIALWFQIQTRVATFITDLRNIQLLKSYPQLPWYGPTSDEPRVSSVATPGVHDAALTDARLLRLKPFISSEDKRFGILYDHQRLAVRKAFVDQQSRLRQLRRAPLHKPQPALPLFSGPACIASEMLSSDVLGPPVRGLQDVVSGNVLGGGSDGIAPLRPRAAQTIKHNPRTRGAEIFGGMPITSRLTSSAAAVASVAPRPTAAQKEVKAAVAVFQPRPHTTTNEERPQSARSLQAHKRVAFAPPLAFKLPFLDASELSDISDSDRPLDHVVVDAPTSVNASAPNGGVSLKRKRVHGGTTLPSSPKPVAVACARNAQLPCLPATVLLKAPEVAPMSCKLCTAANVACDGRKTCGYCSQKHRRCEYPSALSAAGTALRFCAESSGISGPRQVMSCSGSALGGSIPLSLTAPEATPYDLSASAGAPIDGACRQLCSSCSKMICCCASPESNLGLLVASPKAPAVGLVLSASMDSIDASFAVHSSDSGKNKHDVSGLVSDPPAMTFAGPDAFPSALVSPAVRSALQGDVSVASLRTGHRRSRFRGSAAGGGDCFEPCELLFLA